MSNEFEDVWLAGDGTDYILSRTKEEAEAILNKGIDPPVWRVEIQPNGVTEIYCRGTLIAAFDTETGEYK